MLPKNKPLKPNTNELQTLLSFYQKNQFLDAENLAQSLVKKYPSHPYAWKILAAVSEQTNRIPEALNFNQRALALSPKDPEIHLALGNVLKALGQFEDAISSYNKAIKLNNKYIQAYNNLAHTLRQMGRYEDSLFNFNKVVSLKPNFAQAHYYLGLTFKALGKLDLSLLSYKQAVTLKPNYYQAYYNLANTLKELNYFDEAVENYKKAISLKPDFAEAYNNLGLTLKELERYDEALNNINQAILLNPKYSEAYFGLANILKDLRRLEEAFINYEKATKLKPNYAEALHNWGRALLLNCNFEKANSLMEWRWQTDQKIGVPFNTSRPKWDGKVNQNVLLWREQGVGDEIMFSAAIYDLKSKSNTLFVECDRRLMPLFRRSFPDDIEYISDKSKLSINEYDYHLPVGSLPLYFRKSIDAFKKTSKGWLRADDKSIDIIKNEINKNSNEKIIGISWKSNSASSKANQRNITLQELAEPLKKLNIKLINLQYGNASDEILKLRSDHGIDILEISNLDIFNDLDGLAALISACDCVVSIDNVTPHLAGALGVDTRLLLPQVSDERWGIDSKKSYLYESVKLYRQINKSDWSFPLNELIQDLKNMYHV